MKATLTHRLCQTLALVTVAAAMSSCVTKKSGNYSTSFDPPAKAVTNPSAVKVKLSTGAQRVYVMQGNEVLLATPCSVGTASTPTPHGTFRIYSKQANRRRQSQPGAGYPMSFWMEFKSAYGMHWGWVKPYPCTHGCVRLPIKSAQKIFSMVPTGAPLIIATSHPEDATIGKTLPVLDDSTLADPPMNYMLSAQVFEDAKKGKIYTY
ncbi:L,D-transpeptidase-like protein [Prosthecobacter fusiformis]|uniref:L,D-transpeptidase-like protein n=1 Tax=Prosthecobacter fusiformis TaxID=48464 RepID=A0A4R7RWG2_9BACT|nr:L,D-transpeptidase [Prosthecobacter fusiformis]TDU69358.1 L,D-transpeptidase-like protein [Prosthecobacter fusiformis]